MFQTHYNEVISTVIHKSDGYFSWEQMHQASASVEDIVAGGCATVWDFRLSGSISPDLDCFYAAKAAFRNKTITTSKHRRAFVVADTTEVARLTDMLSKISTPWSWVVKIDMADALAWLGEA